MPALGRAEFVERSSSKAEVGCGFVSMSHMAGSDPGPCTGLCGTLFREETGLSAPHLRLTQAGQPNAGREKFCFPFPFKGVSADVSGRCEAKPNWRGFG